MPPRNAAYIKDVDRLIEQTPVAAVLGHYGLDAPEMTTGEHRMNCVFNKECGNSQYGQLTIRLEDPVNRIFCHTCKVRGNLLTLIHGLETHQPPTGGRLRGDEFKAAVAALMNIAGEGNESQPTPNTKAHRSLKGQSPLPSPPVPVNVPLHRHEKEAARALADLHEDLITDVSQMSPEASAYVRSRPWMTPKLMKKWGVGWIPGNGRSLFRKGYLVYTHRNERGEVVSYSGRDLSFEAKWTKWLRRGDAEDRKPNKHRFVSGFHKGSELYGGQASRLKEPYVQKSLQRHGVVVVEGMNDVLRMETLGVAAVGLTSNKATGHQIEKLVRFAQTSAKNRVNLFPDCDAEGESGFQDLLWKLNEQRVDVKLLCTSTMHDGQFAGRDPEKMSDEEFSIIDQTSCPPQLNRS